MEGEKIHQLALYYQMALERLKFAAASMSVTFDDLHQQQRLVPPPLGHSSREQFTNELLTKMLKSSAGSVHVSDVATLQRQSGDPFQSTTVSQSIDGQSHHLDARSTPAGDDRPGTGSTPTTSMNYSCSTSFSIDRILGDDSTVTRVFERRPSQVKDLGGSSAVNDSRFQSTIPGVFGQQPSSKLFKCDAIGFNERNSSDGSRLETFRRHNKPLENNNEFYKYGMYFIGCFFKIG